MSIIVKTEAVVLKVVKYGDSSKIVTFFTLSNGKISGIVKGARSSRRRYGSPIDSLSYVSLLFYHKEGRDIQTVSQCDTILSLHHIPEVMEKMSVGLTAVELIYRLLPEHEANPPLFRILIDTLRTLNDATKSPMNLLYYFEYHFARILGFDMSFGGCGICSKSFDAKSVGQQEVIFDFDRGSIVCSVCRGKCKHPVALSHGAICFLSALSDMPVRDVIDYEVNDTQRAEVEKFLWNYLSFHNQELETFKSRKVFSKLMRNP